MVAGPAPTCWSTRTGSAAIRASSRSTGFASWTPRKGIVMLRNPGPTAAGVRVGRRVGLRPARRRGAEVFASQPLAEDSAESPALEAEAGRPLRLKARSVGGG